MESTPGFASLEPGQRQRPSFLLSRRLALHMGDGPSKTQIDKAGQHIREWLVSEADSIDTPEPKQAFVVFEEFRSSFFPPLQFVAGALTFVVNELAPGRKVVSRHKKASRIAEKLLRRPSMRLTQMEDIGGCRAVLPDRELVRRVQAEVLDLWPDAHVDDYVSRPKTSGYRALHIVAVVGERRIEVQLRTERQNEWADAVERTADRLGLPLKDEEGPAELLEYFRRAADRIAIEEEGGTIDQEFEAAFAALREQVRPYFKRE